MKQVLTFILTLTTIVSIVVAGDLTTKYMTSNTVPLPPHSLSDVVDLLGQGIVGLVLLLGFVMTAVFIGVVVVTIWNGWSHGLTKLTERGGRR